MRLQRRFDLSETAFKLPKRMGMPDLPTSGTMEVTENFTDVRIDPQIPATTFARPKSA